MTESASRERKALLALTAAAFGFRLALLLLPRVIRWDEPVYLLLGQNLWNGLGFTFNGHPELHHSPLFPILTGATLKLTGRPEEASNIWYVLLGALLTLPVYGLARRLTSHGGALLAAALVAFFPALTTAVLYWGTMIEPLFLLLIYSAAYLTMRGLDSERPGFSVAAFAIAGALTGLAYLARPEGLLWMISLAGAAVIVWALRRGRDAERPRGRTSVRRLEALTPPAPLSHPPPLPPGERGAVSPEKAKRILSSSSTNFSLFSRRTGGRMGEEGRGDEGLGWRPPLAALVALPLVFLAVALPQFLFLRRHTGQWMISGKLGITYEIGRAVEAGDPVLYDEIINSLDSDGEIRAASEARYRRGQAGTAGVKPAEASGRFVRNFGHVLKSSLTSEIFSALLLLPAAWWLLRFLRGPWSRRRLEAEILMIATVAPVASFLAFHVQQRFFAPAFPGLLIWTAAGLRDFFQRLPAGRTRAAATVAAALAIASYFIWADVEIARHGIATSDFGHEEAGLWLRAHSAPDARIMTQDTAIAVYADRGYVFSPRAPMDRFLDYGRRHGATHVAVDEAEVTIVRPFLKPLLESPPPGPPGLALLWTGRDGHVGRTLLFSVRPEP
ncbi:MAG: hypothetical protein QOF89_4143 [Acidobacteriota bacterium]|jgi:hypothetical protein|nr:hypothetical protein [Acidobacteriota bacterium]